MALVTAAAINDMLNGLEEDDYKAAVSFIEYLSDSRKKRRLRKVRH